MLDSTFIDGNQIEFRVSGRLEHGEVSALLRQCESIIEHTRSLRILMEIDQLDSIEPQALLDELEFEMTHADEIQRCAVITEQAGIGRLFEILGSLMPRTEVRCFPKAQHPDAQLWLRS